MSRHPALRVVGLLVLVPLLAGCPQLVRDGDRDRRNAAETARLSEQLADLPGVQRADVDHLLDASTPGAVSVALVVEPSTSTATVTDAVLEAVWRSGLDPVGSVRIDLAEPDGTSRPLTDPLVWSRIAPELAQRHGPRSVGDR